MPQELTCPECGTVCVQDDAFGVPGAFGCNECGHRIIAGRGGPIAVPDEFRDRIPEHQPPLGEEERARLWRDYGLVPVQPPTGAIAQALATLEAAGWQVPLDARTATPPLRDDRMLYVPCITKDDLAAILRADPDRAVEAIEMAKIAGPWVDSDHNDDPDEVNDPRFFASRGSWSHYPREHTAVAEVEWLGGDEGEEYEWSTRIDADVGGTPEECKTAADTALLADGWVLAKGGEQ